MMADLRRSCFDTLLPGRNLAVMGNGPVAHLAPFRVVSGNRLPQSFADDKGLSADQADQEIDDGSQQRADGYRQDPRPEEVNGDAPSYSGQAAGGAYADDGS